MTGTRARSAARRLGTTLALPVLATALVAGCGSDGPTLTSRQQDVRSTDTDVAFKDCGSSCRGTLDGAPYSVVLPRKWNGTLLLYSHGYRFRQPAPPDFSPVSRSAQVSSTDSDGTGQDALSKELLAQGYALAGSAYRTNGWAVADGVKADETLHAWFADKVGTPKRTYVWGDSLGGLITEIVAEKHPEWVDGAAPMCGAVAGPTDNLDIALDVAVAVKALIDPQLKLTGYASADEAASEWTRAADALKTAAADTAGGGTAKVLFIAALVDAADRTRTYDGSTIESRVKGTVESLLTALAYGTSGRYEIEQRVGGNPSQTTGVDWAARVDATEAGLVRTVGGDPTAYEAVLARQPTVTADAAARTAFEGLGDTTGRVRVPTLTMHTVADPLVLVQNETVLRQRADRAGRLGSLVQLYVAPPTTYSESTGAPYGAGHCVFSDGQRLGLVRTLDRWVRGAYPLPSGVAAAFGPGLDPSFTPGPWPADAG